MSKFAVKHVGTDSSGRAILMTAYMRDWWESCVAEMRFRPTIVQGAFMTQTGGGAKDSSGYHDQGGCLDLRVRDLTETQIQTMNRVIRSHGAGGWLRNQAHGGMDPHYHLVLGTDRPIANGAAVQWQQYLAGRDGLASNGPDYMWRPTPVVTEPPEDDMYTDADRAEAKKLRQDLAETRRALGLLARQILSEGKDDATKADLAAAVKKLDG